MEEGRKVLACVVKSGADPRWLPSGATLGAVRKLKRKDSALCSFELTVQNARSTRSTWWSGRVGPLSPCADFCLEGTNLGFFSQIPS